MLIYNLENTYTDAKLKQKRFLIEHDEIKVSFTVDLKSEKVTSICVDLVAFFDSKELISPTDILFDEELLKYLRWFLEFENYMIYFNRRCVTTNTGEQYANLKRKIMDIINL